MANLDSSWQASVIKLAQAGNSRAITFWLNRDLVPQGVCAQITAEPSGCLAIQIVSRQPPNCDKLVRYICQRLSQLDSEAIQQIRVTAQQVGAAEPLWEKTARIIPPSARRVQVAQLVQTAQPVQTAQLVQTAQPERVMAASLPLASPSGAASAKSASTKSASAKPAPTVVAPSDADLPLVDIAAVAPPAPKSAKRSAKKTAKKTARPAAAPGKLGILAGRKISVGNLQYQLHSQMQALKLGSVSAADHSIRWFVAQKPAGRALALSGAAVTAFLIGCSFELAGYYVNPAAFQRSKATITGAFRSAIPSGSVQTASERLPIIQQPVLNPDDPNISLIFSNSNLLTRLPVSQRLPGQVNPETPLVTTVEAYRQADMLITNLNHPVVTATPDAADPAANSPDSVADPANSSQTTDAADAADSADLQLSGLPANAEAAKTSAGDGDHEAEKMDFIADEAREEPAPEEGITPAVASETQSFLTPQELVANRVNLVSWANSAAMPEGSTQLTQTVNLLKQGNIHAVGVGQNLPEARRPQIFEVKGKRIAYLGYADSSPRAASGMTAGVNVSVNRQMQADIEAIRDQVDWVVVSVNWNRELRAYPEDWQVNLAHAAVDYGADLVVGYHPTATQGGEIYNGRAIVYSLGDRIDEYSEQPVGNYEAAALKVTLEDHIMQLDFLPLQVKRGQAQLAEGETAARILQYVQQASSLFEQPLRSLARLNSQVRLTLPAAPDSEMPTDPFIHYPSPEASSEASPEASPAQPSSTP